MRTRQETSSVPANINGVVFSESVNSIARHLPSTQTLIASKIIAPTTKSWSADLLPSGFQLYTTPPATFAALFDRYTLDKIKVRISLTGDFNAQKAIPLAIATDFSGSSGAPSSNIVVASYRNAIQTLLSPTHPTVEITINNPTHLLDLSDGDTVTRDSMPTTQPWNCGYMWIAPLLTAATPFNLIINSEWQYKLSEPIYY